MVTANEAYYDTCNIEIIKYFFFWWDLVAFIDHFTHLYEIAMHQLSYMQLYNTQHAYNPLQNTIQPWWLTYLKVSDMNTLVDNNI